MGADQRRQRALRIGHVDGVLEALEGAARPDRIGRARGVEAEHRERQVGERAAARRHRVGRVPPADLVRLEGPGPVVAQRARQLALQRFARRVDAQRVAGIELLGDVAFARQGQHQFLERGIERRIAQHAAHRLDEAVIERDGPGARAPPRSGAEREALAGFPAVERIGVVREQDQQVGVGQAVDQRDRRREAAQQRRHRLDVDVDEGDEGARLVDDQQRARCRSVLGSSSSCSGSGRPSRPSRPSAIGITNGAPARPATFAPACSRLSV